MRTVKNILKDFSIFIAGIIGLAILMCFLFGCSTVHKSSTSTQRNVDLKVEQKIDTSSVKKLDSNSVTKEGFDYYRETVEEDFAPGRDKAAQKTDTSTSKGDYNSLISTGTETAQETTKRTITKEWGKYTKEQTVNKKLSDSSGRKEEKKIDSTGTEKIKETVKDKSGFSWGKIIVPALFIVGFVILFFIGRGVISWFSKKFL